MHWAHTIRPIYSERQASFCSLSQQYYCGLNFDPMEFVWLVFLNWASNGLRVSLSRAVLKKPTGSLYRRISSKSLQALVSAESKDYFTAVSRS